MISDELHLNIHEDSEEDDQSWWRPPCSIEISDIFTASFTSTTVACANAPPVPQPSSSCITLAGHREEVRRHGTFSSHQAVMDPACVMTTSTGLPLKTTRIGKLHSASPSTYLIIFISLYLYIYPAGPKPNFVWSFTKDHSFTKRPNFPVLPSGTGGSRMVGQGFVDKWVINISIGQRNMPPKNEHNETLGNVICRTVFFKRIQPFVRMVYCCAIADQLALYSICGWAMCM